MDAAVRLAPLPASFAGTRAAVHRVATHVLARRRHAVTQRFGLRAAPGGLATPAFGAGVEVVRLSRGGLVHERDGRSLVVPLAGATLGGLAEVVGVDLASDFSAGHDTPPLGDTAAPLGLDPAAMSALGDWYDLGAVVLDRALSALGPAAQPSVVQLWPEHFDLACDVAHGPGDDQRANLGCSPGDASSDEPYLYVGPYGPQRPGDHDYWNAPFGATLTRSTLAGESDPVAAAVAFLVAGVTLLRDAG